MASRHRQKEWIEGEALDLEGGQSPFTTSLMILFIEFTEWHVPDGRGREKKTQQ